MGGGREEMGHRSDRWDHRTLRSEATRHAGQFPPRVASPHHFEWRWCLEHEENVAWLGIRRALLSQSWAHTIRRQFQLMHTDRMRDFSTVASGPALFC